MNLRKDLFYLFLLLTFAVILWSPALLPGNTLFFWDLANEIIPKRHFFAKTCGITLWCPYIFTGTPYAANSQSEAFYPFNFLYCWFGAERGLVYYIVFHHALFMLTLYLALRRLAFSAESSLIGSLAGGLGGYMMSLSEVIVLLTTATWMPLIIICLAGTLGKEWLRWSLLLGPVLALQFLAGEYEISAMTIAFAFFTVLISEAAGPKDLGKMTAGLLIGLAFGITLSLPQLALTLQMIPLSNRHLGLEPKEALQWSVEWPMLKNLVVPNFYLPYSAGVYSYLGKFTLRNYFESFYLGAGLVPLAGLGLFNRRRSRVLAWSLVTLFGLVMMMGEQFPLPVYEFIHLHLPGMKFFRYPAKFFMFFNFGFMMMAVLGYQFLEGRKWRYPLISLVLVIAGLCGAGLLVFAPVKVAELNDKYMEIVRYFFMRSVLRAAIFFLLGLGLVLVCGTAKKTAFGILFALAVFGDFFLANHYLNPAVGLDFFQPSQFVRDLKEQEKNRLEPVRFFSVFNPGDYRPKTVESRFYMSVKGREYFNSTWAVYFDLNNLRGEVSFYPLDIGRYKAVIAGSKWPLYELVLARSGVEYVYEPETGFRKLPAAWRRARIFYHAQTVSKQREAIKLWSSPEFPAEQTLLLEDSPQIDSGPAGALMSDPAEITAYANEKVTIEAEAKDDGWLLLLDAYYPGWKAAVDGKRSEIYRADGFFRAVKIPKGRHRVEFSYFPDLFRNSLYASGFGFLLWIMLMAWSLARRSELIWKKA
jgi:hypothetical protein